MAVAGTDTPSTRRLLSGAGPNDGRVLGPQVGHEVGPLSACRIPPPASGPAEAIPTAPLATVGDRGADVFLLSCRAGSQEP
jgi:hypothetical protein